VLCVASLRSEAVHVGAGQTVSRRWAGSLVCVLLSKTKPLPTPYDTTNTPAFAVYFLDDIPPGVGC
jgi:hypothetical protein